MNTVNHNSTERQTERANISFIIKACRSLKKMREMHLISDNERDFATRSILPKRLKRNYRTTSKTNMMKDFYALDKYSDEFYRGV